MKSIYRPTSLISFGCLNPIEIVNSTTKETLRVPCRNCTACRNSASLRTSSLISSDLDDERYSFKLFLTCTYRNSNIPKCYFDTSDDILTRVYDDATPEDNFVTLYSCEDGSELGCYNLLENDYKHLVSIGNHYAKTYPSFFGKNEIPVLRYSDLQQFLCLLRERCRRKFGKVFRYVCCGEYGPKTTRPHYHVLLQCQSEEMRSYLYECACTCWRYGLVHKEYFTGTNGQYLSSYVTSNIALPAVYRNLSIRPKCRHSQFLGVYTFKKNSDFIKFIKGIPIKYNTSSLQEVKTYPLPHSLEVAVFPKCRNFDLSGNRLQYQRYNFTTYYDRKFGYQLSNRGLAFYIAKEIVLFRRKSFQKDFLDMPFIPPYYLELFRFDLIDRLKLKDLVTRIYNDILVSRKFLESSRLYSKGYNLHHYYKLMRYYYERSLLIDNYKYDILSKIENDIEASLVETYLFPNHVDENRRDDYKGSNSFNVWLNYSTALSKSLSAPKYHNEPLTCNSYD